MAAKKAAATQGTVFGHSIFVVLAIELLAVGLFTLIAGIGDNFASVVVVFMAGLWIIYLITSASIVSGLGNSLAKIANSNAA